MKALILATAMTLAAAVAHAQIAASDSVAPLEGLWVSENEFGPALSGEIGISRDSAGWSARLAGAEARAAALDLEFPDGQGRFAGLVVDRGRAIDGMWFQPQGLPGQAYATPMRLERMRANLWRGTVTPLPQSFTLFLRVRRNEEGQWVGAFRNPEFNMNGGVSRFPIARDGNTVDFLAPDGGDRRGAELSPGGDRVRLAWPPLPVPLELSRADENAAGYLPRPGGAAAYVYAPPARLGDGWRTARAGAAGFEESALAELVQRIASGDPAARRPQLIHSLLVARRGRLVLEEYFHGFDRDTPHDIRSAGKTFASVLLGAAMREGARIGPETRITNLLQARGPFANADARKSQITLAQLLTHSSGLACNDYDDASPGNEGAMQGQSEQPDWWRFALDLPMAHDPGARYAYCTAGTNLVGAALHAATGEHLPNLFDHLVARPLRFGRYHWNLMPNGEGYLGGGVYMRPRDLLKIGQLYLNGGVWNGHRVVSNAWVSQSTAPHVEINEVTTGLDAATFANVAIRGADGFGWHRYGVRVGGRVLESYEANGNGGQFLIVVPEYELAVVLTGGNYGQGGIWNRWRDEIVGAGIVAALRD